MTSTRSSDWTDDHGRAVREASPDVPPFTEHERKALWRQIQVAGADTEPRRSRRRWKTLVAGVVAAGAVGVAGAATAEVLTAHTGNEPSDAEDIELGGPGERLNPTAPDFAAVLVEVTTDIHFPSEQSREQALAWETDNYSSDPAQVSTGAVRLWMAGHALCSWTNTWAVAARTGDDVAERRAADVILGARTWPAITASDPEMANESEFAWLPVLQRAVESGDPSAASDALAPHQSCMPGLAPELGMGTPK